MYGRIYSGVNGIKRPYGLYGTKLEGHLELIVRPHEMLFTCLIFGLKERLVARGRRSAVRLKENTHTEAKTASFWPSIFFLNELTKTIFLPDPSLSTPTHTLPPHPPNTKTFNPHLLHCRPAKNKKLNFYTMTL